jgi:hypothetical protein
MSTQQITHILTQTVDNLSEEQSLKGLFHQHTDGDPLPSGKKLEDIIELARAILFPGYYGKSSVNLKTIKYQIGVTITAKNTIITSWKEKWDGNIIPCLVTSIIPDDMVAPRSTPNDATINTTLKVATLAPIADCKKFTASLLTPTKRSKTAKQSRKTTISK